MNSAHLTAPLKRPETLLQWLCLLTLIVMGWVSSEQLGVMFAEDDDGALLFYDKDGNGVLYLSDAVAGRRPTPGALCFDFAQDERSLNALDLALMKPSCCEAPAGLAHFWSLPKQIGSVLVGFSMGPAVLDSS